MGWDEDQRRWACVYACICVVIGWSFMLNSCHLSLTLFGNGSVFFHFSLSNSRLLASHLPQVIFFIADCWNQNHNSAYLSLILVYFVLTVTSSVLWTEGHARGTAASQVDIGCVDLLLSQSFCNHSVLTGWKKKCYCHCCSHVIKHAERSGSQTLETKASVASVWIWNFKWKAF